MTPFGGNLIHLLLLIVLIVVVLPCSARAIPCLDSGHVCRPWYSVLKRFEGRPLQSATVRIARTGKDGPMLTRTRQGETKEMDMIPTLTIISALIVALVVHIHIARRTASRT